MDMEMRLKITEKTKNQLTDTILYYMKCSKVKNLLYINSNRFLRKQLASLRKPDYCYQNFQVHRVTYQLEGEKY